MKFSKIMVVDDCAEDHYLNRIILEKYNPTLKVIEAYDGEEALELLADAETLPELIFLDVNMPRMNGFEFLEAYETRNQHPPIVVMLTTSMDAKDRSRAGEFASVTDFLHKPLEVEHLLKLEKEFERLGLIDAAE